MSTFCKLSVSLVFFACSLIISTSSYAISSIEALDEIAEFAEKICGKEMYYGSTENLELSGEARAELRSLLRKFADVGVKGKGSYELTEYEGVLQKDLKEIINNNTNCKLEVFRELKDKLIENPIRSTSEYKINNGTVKRNGYEVTGVEYNLIRYIGNFLSGDYLYSLVVHMANGRHETLNIKLPYEIENFAVSPNNRFAAWTLKLGGDIYLFDSIRDNSSTISCYKEGYHNEKGLVWVDNNRLKIWEGSRTNIYSFGDNKEILSSNDTDIALFNKWNEQINIQNYDSLANIIQESGGAIPESEMKRIIHMLSGESNSGEIRIKSSDNGMTKTITIMKVHKP